MTAGAGLTYVYNSYNKPHSISRGANTILFADDADHQRFQQFSSAGTTTYMAASGTMAERLDGSGGSVQWTNYLVAGGELVGMRVENGGTVYTRYFNKDHLGSIAVISNETDAVVERLSYDAWGKRRYPDGTDDTTGSITSQTTRGFTGHEELADVALVHMNGRVYDPLLGRFGTADPTTENPLSTQGWNRYSYVGNSPLNFADPTGYCFLGCFFQNIFNALQSLFRSIPILGTILQIALVAIICSNEPFTCAATVAALSSAFVAGVTSGSLGQALRAGITTAITVVAFVGLGQIVGPSPAFATPEYYANIAGSAAIGCLSSVASGGKCGPGALSQGVSAAAAPLISMAPGGQIGKLTATSVVGGLASVAGGGKFSNGATTAAFQYLVTRSLEDARQADAGSPGSGDWRDAQDADRPGIGHNGGPALDDLPTSLGRIFSRIMGAAGFYFGSTDPAGGGGDLSIGDQIGMLREAAGGKGNFSLGSASASDSARLGEAWVGPDYTTTSKDYLLSDDGLRLYRPPSTKPMWSEIQSNFQQRFQPSGQWQSNGHLTITGP